MTIPSDKLQAISHLAQTSATEARPDDDIVRDGRPAILLSGNTRSQCLPTASLAVLDLTHFAIQDIPVLEQLAERLNERGLILWSTRLFRPELDRAIRGGVFVHV
jgi:hypothetical protein